MNYAAFGNDYIKSYDIGPVNFIVDTFTVAEPDEHFIYSPDTWGNPKYDITIQIDHHFLDQVNADLYVDPSGDDSNTGSSFDDPLKTISFALQKIKTDSRNQRTIFLHEGIYSSESNNEFLPLNPRSYLSIKGVSSENTIIDGQNEISFMYSNASVRHLTIKNISFINGFGNINDFPGCSGLEINSNSYFILDSSNFYNCIGANGVFYNMNPFEVVLRHINAYNSIGGLSIGSNVTEDLSFKLINSSVKNIMPAANPNYGIGGGIIIIGTQSGSTNLKGFFYNNLLENNICHPDPFWGDGGGSGIYLINPSLINILNCTFSENEMEEFDGGEENVYNKNNYNNFNWLEGNMDEDPLWVGGGEPFNYELQPESPCINTGVPMYEAGMDYPYIKEEEGNYVLYMLEGDTVTLPSTDLAGNPRISGGRIDMGAYEWQDTSTVSSKFEVRSSKLRVFPNPFKSNMFISFSTSNEYQVSLEVIDMNGNRICTIADNHFPAGDYRLVWDGKDEYNRSIKNALNTLWPEHIHFVQ